MTANDAGRVRWSTADQAEAVRHNRRLVVAAYLGEPTPAGSGGTGSLGSAARRRSVAAALAIGVLLLVVVAVVGVVSHHLDSMDNTPVARGEVTRPQQDRAEMPMSVAPPRVAS